MSNVYEEHIFFPNSTFNNISEFTPPTCYDSSVAPSSINGKLLIFTKCLAVLFILITNVTVIIGIIGTKQANLFSYKLLIVICFTDFFLGVFSVPVSIMVMYKIPSCQLVTMKRLLDIGLGYFSLINMMCLSLDRYIFVTKQEIYKKLTNKARFLLTLFASIALSSLLTIYGHCSWSNKDFLLELANQLCLLASIQAFLFLMMITINVLLVRYVRKNAKVMKSKSQNQTRRNYESKVTQTIAIITIVYLLTNLPCFLSTIYSAVLLYKRHSNRVQAGNLFVWAKIPFLMNAGLNSVVVIMKNTKIKNYYRKKFTNRVGILDSSNDMS